MVSVQDPALSTRDAPPPSEWDRQRASWWWVPGAITVLTIAAVIVVTLWQLHPSHLLSNTTTTGGDTGAHIAMPWYMRSLIAHGHLTGWYPGWYDGMPLYTFYFTLPDFFIAVGSWIIPFDVAFKIGTVLGSVLLPITAWACGRFFRLRPPIPTLLAAATLPFLFDYTYTIYGGNLFSTLAGEYAFSFGVALAILFLGLFAAAVREGRHRAWAAVVLAGCVLSHIVPGLYAVGGAVVLTVIELLPARWGIGDKAFSFWRDDPGAAVVPWTRTLWRAASTVGIGLLLTAFWLVPFGLERAYATSMGYVNLTTYLHQLFPEADTWALVLAGFGVVMAVLLRSRFGLTVTALGAAFALAEVFDPQGSLYNVRLLPMWFVSVYLMAAWAFGVGCILVARAWRRSRELRWESWEASLREPVWAEAAPVADGGDADATADTDAQPELGQTRFDMVAVTAFDLPPVPDAVGPAANDTDQTTQPSLPDVPATGQELVRSSDDTFDDILDPDDPVPSSTPAPVPPAAMPPGTEDTRFDIPAVLEDDGPAEAIPAKPADRADAGPQVFPVVAPVVGTDSASEVATAVWSATGLGGQGPGAPVTVDAAPERKKRRGLAAVVGLAALIAVAGVGIHFATGSSGTPADAAVGTSAPSASAPTLRTGVSAPASGSATASPGASGSPTSSTGDQNVTSLPIASVAAYGPAGLSDGDDQAGAQNAIAANPAQPWVTQWYATADFGDLKNGTGLLLNLGGDVTVTSVHLDLATNPGGALELQVGNGESPADFSVAATASGIAGGTTVTLPHPVAAQYLLIWFTQLPPNGQGEYMESVSGVTVSGRR